MYTIISINFLKPRKSHYLKKMDPFTILQRGNNVLGEDFVTLGVAVSFTASETSHLMPMPFQKRKMTCHE